MQQLAVGSQHGSHPLATVTVSRVCERQRAALSHLTTEVATLGVSAWQRAYALVFQRKFKLSSIEQRFHDDWDALVLGHFARL
jgi:hypothetical protein